MKKYLFAFVLLGAAFLAKAQGVNVFGLPLGGAIENPALCKSDDENQDLCWFGEVPPHWHKTGEVNFKKESVPSWVMDGESSISISSKGLLDKIEVILRGRTVSKKHTDAVASISNRFGKPTKSAYFNGRGYANWNLANITILTGFDIYDDWGYVEFKSPARVKEDKALEAKIPKRPVTP